MSPRYLIIPVAATVIHIFADIVSSGPTRVIVKTPLAADVLERTLAVASSEVAGANESSGFRGRMCRSNRYSSVCVWNAWGVTAHLT